MNANEIFDRYKQPGEDDPIADRARWHQAVDSDPTVPQEIKVVLRWYWNQVEALETEREHRDWRSLLLQEGVKIEEECDPGDSAAVRKIVLTKAIDGAPRF